MSCRLLIVEEAFLITRRGVILAPWIEPHALDRVGEIILEVRSPTRTWQVSAYAQLPRMKPPQRAAILLCGLSKADVPVGSEIWSVEGGE